MEWSDCGCGWFCERVGKNDQLSTAGPPPPFFLTDNLGKIQKLYNKLTFQHRKKFFFFFNWEEAYCYICINQEMGQDAGITITQRELVEFSVWGAHKWHRRNPVWVHFSPLSFMAKPPCRVTSRKRGSFQTLQSKGLNSVNDERQGNKSIISWLSQGDLQNNKPPKWNRTLLVNPANLYL